MSELLKEANRLEDKALDDFYMSYKMPFEDGYFQGIEVMRKLIEKHEKPKGLVNFVDPAWDGVKNTMAKVARQKQCKYCHEPHNYIFIYEENEPNPDMTNGYINHEGILCIQYSRYGFVNLNINYCPVCGRDLKEVE